MLNRRDLLAGTAAVTLLPVSIAQGFLPSESSSSPRWKTLPLGCGGLVTGFTTANDGVMYCRTDVGNIYRWTGIASIESTQNPEARWVPLMTFASMGATTVLSGPPGASELMVAPSDSSRVWGIMADNLGTANRYYVYYSSNSGGTWTKSNLFMRNADPNGPQKIARDKIAVDPANPDVVYVGMPMGSGNSFAVYRALDGRTFNALTNGPIGVNTTLGAGTCGICFDPSQGTVVVSGQTRTARIIVPVGGAGIFESLDGGETWTEIAVTSFGSTNFYVDNAVVNTQGIYYAVVVSGSIGNRIRRYSGPSGMWVTIDPTGSYGVAGTIIAVDPRPGNEGYLMATGPNGIGIGFQSRNANTGRPPSWVGATSGQRPALAAPDYDIPYLNRIFGQFAAGRNPFTGATTFRIDLNGVLWWAGNQSIWYMPTVPDYGAKPPVSTSISFGRGMEVTVAQDVLCPPGGQFAVLAPQDLGVMRGTNTSYPTDYFVPYQQFCCECLDYSPTTPSFVVARITDQRAGYTDATAYSENYGAPGSWVQPATTPTDLWQAAIVGGLSNGTRQAGNVLDVTAVNRGTVQLGQWVTPPGRSTPPVITSQLTGTPGGVGTYQVDNSSFFLAPGTSIKLQKAIQGGVVTVIDNDHWICVPSGYQQIIVPARTANARDPLCTWSLTNLPNANWTRRSWVHGITPRVFAAGNGPDVGIVWAALYDPAGKVTIFRSRDYGATFTQIAGIPYSVACVGVYLLSVPGFPGELWLAGAFTGGSNFEIRHSTNYGDSWSTVVAPTGQNLTLNFTLGAPAKPGGYPTIFGQFCATYGAPRFFYEGQWDGARMKWSLFGPTGTTADLPISCQVAGVQSMRGDYNKYRKLFVSSNQSGFAYYDPG